MVTATAELERYIQAAKDAGVSGDQLRRFIAYGYIAQPKQLLFHAAARECDLSDGPVDVGLGGARGPGKSHSILSQVALDDCQRVDGLKWLFLRKVLKAAAESFDDLVRKVLAACPYDYKVSAGKVIFPNGSRILIGGFNDEQDIDKYLGIEYDGIAVEEATLLSEIKIDKIKGSVRTSKDNWRPRMYYSSNPGGIGHQWFRSRFVKPSSEYQKVTRFIFSTYKDNAFLNPEYRQYLENLKGPLGKAWRDGDWDVFEGLAFPTWVNERHVIKPFEIPDWWPKWRAIDWGYRAPFCCLWLAKNPDNGRIIVYRELYRTFLTVRQQARLVREFTPANEHILFTYADPSMWAKKDMNDQVTCSADEYFSESVPLTKADNNRLDGKRKIDQALGDLPDGLPGLQVFESCENLIRVIETITFDEHQVEDVDTKQEDHPIDTLKYGLSNERIAKPKKEEQQPQRVSGLQGIRIL